MRVSSPPTLLLAVLAAALAPPGVADGQCRLCSAPTTAPATDDDKARPISLDIDTSLNFDRLVMAGSGSGSAVVRPDGSALSDGSVANVSPRAMVGSATVHGEPGRIVRVELPRRIELFSTGGGRIAVDEVSSDLPAIARLDGSGSLTFRFGGRIHVSGEIDGQFRGDLPITVEYL
jgi:hypothetical protein